MDQKSAEYTVIVNCTTKLEKALKDNRDIVHFLQRNNFISQDTHDFVLSTTSLLTPIEKSGMLVEKIRDKVELNPRHFHSLLEEFNSHREIYEDIILILKLEMEKLGVVSKYRYAVTDVSSKCEVKEKSVSLPSLTQEQFTLCSSASDKSYATHNAQDVLARSESPFNCIQNLEDLKEEVDSLDYEFNDLVHDFVDFLEKNTLTVDNLKKIIEIVPGSYGAAFTPLWKKIKPELELTSKVQEFLASLNSNLWNFLDYQMLQYLIKKCNAKLLTEKMQVYAVKIRKFKKETLVIPFIECWDGHKIDNIPDFVELKIKCSIRDQDITKYTLARLDILRRSIHRNCLPLLSHFATIMYYKELKQGCIAVSWFFPERFSLVLKYRIQNAYIILEKYQVLWITIDEDCIYSSESTINSKLSFSDEALHAKYGVSTYSLAATNTLSRNTLNIVDTYISFKDTLRNEDLDYDIDNILSQANAMQEKCQSILNLSQLSNFKQSTDGINAMEQGHVTDILDAALNGDTKKFKRLTADLKGNHLFCNAKEQTALHLAVIGGHKNITQLILLQANTSVLQTDIFGLTPLTYAIVFGHLDIFIMLMDRLVIKTTANTLKATAIIFEGFQMDLFSIAIIMEQKHIVLWLLKKLPHNTLMNILPFSLSIMFNNIFELLFDVFSVSSEIKQSALFVAAARGKLEVFQSLLNIHHCKALIQTKDGFTPLYYAVLNGHINLIKYIFEYTTIYKSLDFKNNQLLIHLATKKGHFEIVQYLAYNNYCDANSKLDGSLPLHSACKFGHFDIAKYLIENCCSDPHSANMFSNTPLNLAVFCGNLELVKYLTDNHHCDVNVRGQYGTIPLHVACNKGHLEVAKHLLEYCHSDPHSTDDDNSTPLHLAAQTGSLELVKYLTDNHHCDVNMRKLNGRIPLHVACIEGHLDVARHLIEHCHTDPHSTDKDSNTPLHLAVLSGNLDLVKYLADNYQCDVNTRGQYGRLPLHVACGKGHLFVAKYLTEYCHSDPHFTDGSNNTPLHLAALSGNLELIKYLTDYHHCDVNARGQYGRLPLHVACERGYLDVVKHLIELCHSDPQSRDEDSDTPLHLAAHSGKLELVKYLIDCHHCDVNLSKHYGYIPLHVACIEGYLDVARYLIEHSHSDPHTTDEQNNTLLHLGAFSGNLELVKYLLDKHHCNVNTRGQSGQLPLHVACTKGHFDVAKHLIEHCHSDPHSMDEHNNTPLHLAALSGNLELVKYLTINHHCDVNARKQYKRIPLHVACIKGYLDIAKFFIEHCHSDLYSTDEDNNNSLHLAALSGNLELVRYLTDSHHCDVNIRGRDGRLPLHLACHKGYLGVAKHLIEHCQSDPHTTDEYSNTPLHYAALSGNLKLVQYFTENHHSDVSTRRHYGFMQLYAECIKRGHLELANYLIECHQSDSYSKYKDNDTPAALSSNKELIKSLADNQDSDVNIVTQYEPKPVQSALQEEHLDATENV